MTILNAGQQKREAEGWCSAILHEAAGEFWCQQPLGHESDHFNEIIQYSAWPEKGRKDDDGKTRWDLLPFAGLEQVAKVLTFGAKKYAPENWRLVEGWRWRYFRAAIGHLAKWRSGEKLDAESGLPHLAHAACCVLFMLELDA